MKYSDYEEMFEEPDPYAVEMTQEEIEQMQKEINDKESNIITPQAAAKQLIAVKKINNANLFLEDKILLYKMDDKTIQDIKEYVKQRTTNTRVIIYTKITKDEYKELLLLKYNGKIQIIFSTGGNILR